MRTFITWLVVLGLHLVPCSVYAKDVGPGREIAAIRHDLPILLRHFESSGADIVSVVIDGDQAVAVSGDSGKYEFFALTRLLGKWWFQDPITASGSASPCTNGIGIPEALMMQARASIDLTTPTPAPTARPGEYVTPRTQSDCEFESGPYRMRFTQPDGMPYRLPITIKTRAPSEGESWLTPCNDAFLFFSGTYEYGNDALAPTSPLRIPAGMTIDIWFPFVLDTLKTYRLTIGYVNPVILKLSGTLTDNTLHFTLPAFAIDPRAEIKGEIDGDPQRCP